MKMNQAPFSNCSKMLLIFFCFTMCFQHLLASLEILKLSVQYGNTVYIPCVDKSDQSMEQLHVWEIQGIVYTVHDFTPPWLQKLSNGLFISRTTYTMSGNYSCYITTGQGIEIKKILTVMLEVRDQRTNEPNFLTGEQTSPNETVLQLIVSDNDVIYVPCLQSSPRQLIVWTIDGVLYPVTNLPRSHEQLNRGMVVMVVSGSNIGNIYQCYTTTFDGVLQLSFTINVIRKQFGKPDKKMLDDNLQVERALQASMRLVSNFVNFKAESKSFSFIVESEIGNDCEIGKITYVNEALISNNISALIWEDGMQPGPNITVPSFVFNDENSYVHTYAKKDLTSTICANLGYAFRVHSSEATILRCAQEGFSSCIAIHPQDGYLLTLVWPRYPSSNEDCVCPVFRALPSGGPTFQDCYCFRTQLTVYDIELNEDNLCWKNLTKNENNTRFLLISEKIDFQGQHLQIFESQTQIIIQGPDPFPPNITILSEHEVCIKSESTEWSPVLRTSVTALDNTNDTILQATIPSNNVCLNFPQTCAPLRLVATAYTACTQSSPSIYQGNESGNQCDCIHSKVNVTMQLRVDFNSIAATLNISCFETDVVAGYNIHISNLYLRAMQVCDTDCVSNSSTPFELSCNESEIEVAVTDLIELVQYNVTILWISQTDSQTECQLLDSQTIQTSVRLETWLTIGLSSMMFCVSTIVFIGIIILCCAKRSKQRSSSIINCEPTSLVASPDFHSSRDTTRRIKHKNFQF